MRSIRLALLAAVAAIGLTACSAEREEPAAGSNILIRFDRADYDRMNQFVERFHEGKGDVLMAISPAVEGDPIIYDLQSNGKEIKVTRDAYSSSPGKTTDICRGIDWDETDGRERIALRECGGAAGGMELFGFEK